MNNVNSSRYLRKFVNSRATFKDGLETLRERIHAEVKSTNYFCPLTQNSKFEDFLKDILALDLPVD